MVWSITKPLPCSLFGITEKSSRVMLRIERREPPFIYPWHQARHSTMKFKHFIYHLYSHNANLPILFRKSHSSINMELVNQLNFKSEHKYIPISNRQNITCFTMKQESFSPLGSPQRYPHDWHLGFGSLKQSDHVYSLFSLVATYPFVFYFPLSWEISSLFSKSRHICASPFSFIT